LGAALVNLFLINLLVTLQKLKPAAALPRGADGSPDKPAPRFYAPALRFSRPAPRFFPPSPASFSRFFNIVNSPNRVTSAISGVENKRFLKIL
jgi:hypothetical protein